MTRTQLFFHSISEISGSQGMSVVILTDTRKERSVTVVCDEPMTQQLMLRVTNMPSRSKYLPEVLTEMLMPGGDAKAVFELMVYGVSDGQYKVSLLNKQTLMLRSIRMTDAVLLHLISDTPLYIEERLMQQQSTPFYAGQTGISIPINTIATEQLNKELEKAVTEENYRLASNIYEEIKRRSKKP